MSVALLDAGILCHQSDQLYIYRVDVLSLPYSKKGNQN